MSQKQTQGRTSKIKKIQIAYEKTFSTPEGRDVLFDMMDTCNFMGSSIVDSGAYEPIGMAYRDGQKSIISRILQTITIDKEKFLEMIEQKNQQEDYFNE